MPTRPPDDPFHGFADALKSDWFTVARANQLPPEWDWTIWLLLAGRGFGKTRAGSEWAKAVVESGAAGRIALVAPTASDCRDVIVEGPSGLLAVSSKSNMPTYQPSIRRLTWPNGAIATLFSAEEPDRLRGPQHDAAWCDELASYPSPEVWSNLMFGLRTGRARCIVTATPKPVQLIRDLLAREGKDVAVTRGSTYENARNLSAAYLRQLDERYKGTRLGRQEIFAELLEDVPGALWTRETVEATRVAAAPEALQRIVVAIDPAGSSAEGADETGIIVAGLGQDGHAYVLDDISGRYAPTEWARRALGAFHVWKADRIVCETNYGGEMVANTIAALDPAAPVKRITSSRGKVLRAEPIAAFFEQRQAHIVGSQPELEDQACRFTSDWLRSRDGSPDRIDALVFALTELLLEREQPGRFISESSLMVSAAESGPVPVDDPGFLHTVFASVAGGMGPEPSQLATVYFGAQLLDCARPGLFVLDWDTYDLMGSPDLMAWWASVYARIQALMPRSALARPSGILIEHTGVGGVLLEQGIMSGRQVAPLQRESILQKTVPERAIAAAGYAYSGQVKLTRAAAEKTATFKGVTKNHFLAQVNAFGVGTAPQEAGPLLVAFSNAVLDVCGALDQTRRRR